MAIINVRQYFLDTLVEMVGIESGLAVTIPEAKQLLEQNPPNEDWWRGDRDDPLRLHFDEIENVFLRLLYLVGAISNDRHPKVLLFDYAHSHVVNVPEEYSFATEVPDLPHAMSVANYLEQILLGHLNDRKSLPTELHALPDFTDLVKQFAVREIMNNSFPNSRKWDGIIRLDTLFSSEEAPSQPGTYFNQRFIDYLNVQVKDLTRMHWRQFEYFTGEYFHRIGYRVTVGPGRDDGGVDVRAGKDRILAGPEVILIQCKRHREPYEVEINEVKALWADVQDKGAARGLIATTRASRRGHGLTAMPGTTDVTGQRKSMSSSGFAKWQLTIRSLLALEAASLLTKRRADSSSVPVSGLTRTGARPGYASGSHATPGLDPPVSPA